LSPQQEPAQPRRRRIRYGRIILAVLLAAIVAGLFWLFYPRTMPQSEEVAIAAVLDEIEHLRPVSDFDAIADTRARSVALFEEAGRVIQSPRCLNCHPVTDQPTQTDAMRAHVPWVSRGADGRGEPSMRCETCHNEANFAASGVPGSPNWHLAPIEMGWQGQSLGDICRQLLDPERSHMTREELARHMSDDPLVGWAWNPGGGRTPAPGTHEAFGALVVAWLDTGGECPQ
jgi:hypothetical protein